MKGHSVLYCGKDLYLLCAYIGHDWGFRQQGDIHIRWVYEYQLKSGLIIFSSDSVVKAFYSVSLAFISSAQVNVDIFKEIPWYPSKCVGLYHHNQVFAVQDSLFIKMTANSDSSVGT